MYLHPKNHYQAKCHLHLNCLKRNGNDEEQVGELHKYCCTLIGFNLLFESRKYFLSGI